MNAVLFFLVAILGCLVEGARIRAIRRRVIQYLPPVQTQTVPAYTQRLQWWQSSPHYNNGRLIYTSPGQYSGHANRYSQIYQSRGLGNLGNTGQINYNSGSLQSTNGIIDHSTGITGGSYVLGQGEIHRGNWEPSNQSWQNWASGGKVSLSAGQSGQISGYGGVIDHSKDQSWRNAARGGEVDLSAVQSRQISGYGGVVDHSVDQGWENSANGGQVDLSAVQSGQISGYGDVIDHSNDQSWRNAATGGEVDLSAVQSGQISGHGGVIDHSVDQRWQNSASGGQVDLSAAQSGKISGYGGVIDHSIDQRWQNLASGGQVDLSAAQSRQISGYGGQIDHSVDESWQNSPSQVDLFAGQNGQISGGEIDRSEDQSWQNSPREGPLYLEGQSGEINGHGGGVNVHSEDQSWQNSVSEDPLDLQSGQSGIISGNAEIIDNSLVQSWPNSADEGLNLSVDLEGINSASSGPNEHNIGQKELNIADLGPINDNEDDLFIINENGPSESPRHIIAEANNEEINDDSVPDNNMISLNDGDIYSVDQSTRNWANVSTWSFPRKDIVDEMNEENIVPTLQSTAIDQDSSDDYPIMAEGPSNLNLEKLDPLSDDDEDIVLNNEENKDYVPITLEGHSKLHSLNKVPLNDNDIEGEINVSNEENSSPDGYLANLISTNNWQTSPNDNLIDQSYEENQDHWRPKHQKSAYDNEWRQVNKNRHGQFHVIYNPRPSHVEWPVKPVEDTTSLQTSKVCHPNILPRSEEYSDSRNTDNIPAVIKLHAIIKLLRKLGVRRIPRIVYKNLMIPQNINILYSEIHDLETPTVDYEDNIESGVADSLQPSLPYYNRHQQTVYPQPDSGSNEDSLQMNENNVDFFGPQHDTHTHPFAQSIIDANEEDDRNDASEEMESPDSRIIFEAQNTVNRDIPLLPRNKATVTISDNSWHHPVLESWPTNSVKLSLRETPAEQYIQQITDVIIPDLRRLYNSQCRTVHVEEIIKGFKEVLKSGLSRHCQTKHDYAFV